MTEHQHGSSNQSVNDELLTELVPSKIGLSLHLFLFYTYYVYLKTVLSFCFCS